MKTPALSWNSLEDLVLVAGHAIYIGRDRAVADLDESWVLKDFQKGEPPQYIEHIRSGVELAASNPSSLLVFSGGQTRVEAGPLSEAQSYLNLANQFEWWEANDVRSRATTEDYARDSFENLLFGIARFRESTGHYPRCINLVGWEFKRERFDFHRETIGWPGDAERYRYHGVGTPADLALSVEAEAKTLALFKSDPFGRGDELAHKRERRNPFKRSIPYLASCPVIAGLLHHRTVAGMTVRHPLPWQTSLIN